jgi:hypothetical protein
MTEQQTDDRGRLTAPSQDVDLAIRKTVRQELQARRDFWSHAFCYAVVNAVVVATWLMTGSGYFWPAWLIGLWGVGLLMHAWNTFVVRPVSDEDVEAELRRRRLR